MSARKRSHTEISKTHVVPASKTVVKPDDTDVPEWLRPTMELIQGRLLNGIVKQLVTTHNRRACPEGTEIDADLINKMTKSVTKNSADRLLERFLPNTFACTIAENRDVTHKINYTYNHTLDRHPRAANQWHSGRCWLFAGLNTMRFHLMRRFHLPNTFELSEAYLFFYDKFERCNMFLETQIEMKDRSEFDGEYCFLMKDPIGDGGTWEYFVNLVKKYGVLPKTCYDECLHSMVSGEMNDILAHKLVQFTAEIRAGAEKSPEALRKMKDTKYLPEILSLLRKFFGPPPETFMWSYYEDTEGHKNEQRTQKTLESTTPVEFYSNYIEPTFNISSKITLTHDPRKEAQLYHPHLTASSNIVGAQPNVYIPVTIDELKAAAVSCIKNGLPCWFACDVGRDFCGHRDLLSTEAFDYSSTLRTNMFLSKEDQLRNYRSAPTHAMTLVGVHVDENDNSVRWRVENSWGSAGDDAVGVGDDSGYLQMSDEWFTQYVYEVVVDIDLISDELKQKISANEDNVVHLPFFDPFGNVANRKCAHCGASAGVPAPLRRSSLRHD